MGGRGGYISYYEGPRAVSFYWEFGGGGDVAVIVHVGRTSGWCNQYPWAAGRQREILVRVAQEVIRQRAPECMSDIDESGGYIYFRERKQET